MMYALTPLSTVCLDQLSLAPHLHHNTGPQARGLSHSSSHLTRTSDLFRNSACEGLHTREIPHLDRIWLPWRCLLLW